MPYYPISALYYLSGGPFKDIKSKTKFQTFGSKNGCGGIDWLLMRGGCNWKFDCRKNVSREGQIGFMIHVKRHS